MLNNVGLIMFGIPHFQTTFAKVFLDNETDHHDIYQYLYSYPQKCLDGACYMLYQTQV